MGLHQWIALVANFGSAERINEYIACIGALDGLFKSARARIILPVAHDHQQFGDGPSFFPTSEFLRCVRDCVPYGGTSAGSELVDGMGKLLLVTAEILNDQDRVSHSDYKCEVIAAGQNVFQEMDRCALLQEIDLSKE